MKPLKQFSTRGFFLTLLLMYMPLSAATRSDVTLLEASEDIRFISQQIVKDYFYLAQHEGKQEVHKYLEDGVSRLDEKLRAIATVTNSTDTKDILSFLAYSRDQIIETINEPYNIDNAALILDYSEALLEGAESIGHEYSYDASTQEQMLINVKKMRYLIERITKYYMTFQFGIKDLNNIQQIQEAINAFDTAMQELNSYEYSGQSATAVKKLNTYWPISRKLYLNFDHSRLTNILYISADYLEKTLLEIEYYHTQNL